MHTFLRGITVLFYKLKKKKLDVYRTERQSRSNYGSMLIRFHGSKKLVEELRYTRTEFTCSKQNA